RTARADGGHAHSGHALVRQEMNHSHEADADDADLKHVARLYVRIFCFRFVSSRAARSNSAYRRSVSSENSHSIVKVPSYPIAFRTCRKASIPPSHSPRGVCCPESKRGREAHLASLQ